MAWRTSSIATAANVASPAKISRAVRSKPSAIASESISSSGPFAERLGKAHEDGCARLSNRLPLREVKAAIAAIFSGAGDAEEDELTIASNAAADLVRAGKLDEAEQAARDFQVGFPEVHDGYDRLGMVHEARGENRQAADCYRKVIAFVREHPDDYDPGFEDVFVKLVNRLDPSGAT